MTPMLEGAIYYAAKGLTVFPCEKKIPLTGAGGFKNATLDAEQIHKWWTEYPTAQIGVPTGHVNSLIVLDVDGPEGMAWLMEKSIPATREVETSPGHRQYWFHLPEGKNARCSAGVLAPQIDVRAEGGYVIAPPSIHHESGKPYRFLRNIARAEAPDWLFEPGKQNGNGHHSHAGELVIHEGEGRHREALRLAGGLRARGANAAAILTALEIFSSQHCRPPLEQKWMEKTANYINSKPAGFHGQKNETSAEVELQSFREIVPEAVTWLWRDRVALGKLNLFVGEPSEGKSLATVDIAARLSRGREFPDGAPGEIGDSIILSAEDGAADTIRPRLDTAGADVSRVHRIKAVKVVLSDGEKSESTFSLERDMEKLDEAIAKSPAIRLLVIDPLSAYMGRADTWKDGETRRVLTPLAELADRRRVAVVGIMHLTKRDASALTRVSGSIAFVAAARVVWGFGKHPDNPETRVMVPVKNNLAPLGGGLAYRVEAKANVPFIVWETGSVAVDANDVLATDSREGREGRSTRAEAMDWLTSMLAEGAQPVTAIQERAKEDGMSWATVRRAKSSLQIRAYKISIGGGWAWEMSKGRAGE
jgi:putative DNA primase/helicase